MKHKFLVLLFLLFHVTVYAQTINDDYSFRDLLISYCKDGSNVCIDYDKAMSREGMTSYYKSRGLKGKIVAVYKDYVYFYIEDYDGYLNIPIDKIKEVFEVE
jgi:hypothetical protein